MTHSSCCFLEGPVSPEALGVSRGVVFPTESRDQAQGKGERSEGSTWPFTLLHAGCRLKGFSNSSDLLGLRSGSRGREHQEQEGDVWEHGPGRREEK